MKWTPLLGLLTICAFCISSGASNGVDAKAIRALVEKQYGTNTFGGQWDTDAKELQEESLKPLGKFYTKHDYDERAPAGRNDPMEVEVFLDGNNTVAVGVALAARGRGDVGQLEIWGRELDAETGRMVGSEVHRNDNGSGDDLQIAPRNDQNVVIGWGARAHLGDLTHIAIAYREIDDDGSLGELHWKEWRQPGQPYIDPLNMERKVVLEAPYVLQRIAARMRRGGGNDRDRIANLAVRYAAIVKTP